MSFTNITLQQHKTQILNSWFDSCDSSQTIPYLNHITRDELKVVNLNHDSNQAFMLFEWRTSMISNHVFLWFELKWQRQILFSHSCHDPSHPFPLCESYLQSWNIEKYKMFMVKLCFHEFLNSNFQLNDLNHISLSLSKWNLLSSLVVDYPKQELYDFDVFYFYIILLWRLDAVVDTKKSLTMLLYCKLDF